MFTLLIAFDCVYARVYPLVCLQTVTQEPHLLSQTKEPCHQLVSTIHLTGPQNLLGTPEHIAAFVVNTLFNAIVGVSLGQKYSIPTMAEKMTVWFKAFR